MDIDQALQVLPLTPDYLQDVSRLHKFSSTSAGSVFGTRNLTEVLVAAAGQQDGAFGYVALLTDPDEPEEPEVVGALTAQHTSSSSSSPLEVVLLTLVVRADARRQGVGSALLSALIQHAQQQPVQDHHQQQQQQAPACRVVADVSLANAQAWSFFKRAGFSQGPSSEGTAEATLLVQPHQQQQQQQQPAGCRQGAAAAAAGAGAGSTAALQPAYCQVSWLSAGTSHWQHSSARTQQTQRKQLSGGLLRQTRLQQLGPNVRLRNGAAAVSRSLPAIRQRPVAASGRCICA